jgi:energy-coupling factor transporter ATP-binding protein EcfA2
LSFGPQLTAIFGRNGSGKSGYARVLGCAGFTRGDKEVLPDVTKPMDEDCVISAKINLDVNGINRTIDYQVGKPCHELSTFYIFDSTSVKVHMKGRNTFSFSPAGLSVLTELAQVTDEVRDRLKTKISEKENPSEFRNYFSGNSEITALIEDLGPDTKVKQLESLTKLSEEEKKRIHELNVEIGKIGLEQVQKDIDRKEQNLQGTKRLHTWLVTGNKLIDDQEIADVDTQIVELIELEGQAKKLGIEQFQNRRFSQTGSDLWIDFIRVSRRIAEAESRDNPYPQEGDPCLLCQQPLSEDAQQLIYNLWEYLSGEVQRDIDRIRTNLQTKKAELRREEGFNLGENLITAINLLRDVDTELSKHIQSEVNSIQERGFLVENAIIHKKPIDMVTSMPDDRSQEVQAYIQNIEADLLKLKNEDLEEKNKKLEEDRRNLEHRVKLGELLPDIILYVEGRVWSREASKVGGSTRHITLKYNQLFNSLVKNQYITIFKQILKDLGRTLQVEIATFGSKGETVKQVVLKAHNTVKDLADPEKVLSEGEKRSVALADFLTEVALDTNSSGIVLDDPVTSLDLEWRETIATILIREATKRQVIVFTHDMPFLYYLNGKSEENGVETAIHWIKRGDIDDCPGYVYADNCPALEKEYKSAERARRYYAQSKDAPPESQQALVREGMGALRTTYEAFVIFNLFGGVVRRFEERISLAPLQQIVWDRGIAQDIYQNYGSISRHIEGHLHSDAMAAPLTPKMLFDEIETFEEIKKRHKVLK